MVAETILNDGITVLILFVVLKFILWNKVMDFFYLIFVNKYSFWAGLILLGAVIIEPSLLDTYVLGLNYFIDGFKSLWTFISGLVFEMLFNN